VPIQILESKKMSEDENLFLRNLRSDLAGDDMYKTMQAYKERKLLNDKNVFLDRIVKANPTAFMEAMNMFTEGVREIFLEGADRYGWMNKRYIDRENKKLREVAKNLLSLGVSLEKVAEATGLSLETVIEMAYSGDAPSYL